MMTKKSYGKIFALCSLVLLWSLFSVAIARADRNYFRDHSHDNDDTVADGTVYDAKTGLTWQENGHNGPFTWQEALDYVETLNSIPFFGGCRGWRLPTSKELERLVDHSKHHGSSHIDDYYFPDTNADFYWTSSSHKQTLKYAISFYDGRQRKMSSSNRYYVRAVRDECDPGDNDGDGFLPGADCNDNDPNINPAAVEVCDGNIDNNCDGNIDLSCWNVDNDLDGYTENQGDCNDRDKFVHPGAAETCDGIDNNCDGNVDEGLTFDVDGDGYTTVDSCEGSKDDCNDGNAAVHPGAVEVCGDLVDNDCVGGDLSCLDVDNDGDGYTENAGDCDDNNAAMFPGNPEVCDNYDNNCDGSVDENLIEPTTCGVGVCSGNTGERTCRDGVWGVDSCDPFAGATAETCDGLDNNCNGSVDEDLTQTTSCGVGACAATGIETCSNGSWVGDTCVAGAPVAETCDNVDNDCDGSVDEDLTQATTCGVGACAGNSGVATCTAGVWGGDTCDPLAGAVAESCDNVDNDCDGQVDEGLTIDADGDTHSTPESCAGTKDDCDDSDPYNFPGNLEVCDGRDNNCLAGTADEVCAPSLVQNTGGENFDSIQTACDSVAVGYDDTLFMQGIEFGESLVLDRDIVVTLIGGWDDTFTSSTGWTVISNPTGPALRISKGMVIVNYVVLQ